MSTATWNFWDRPNVKFWPVIIKLPRNTDTSLAGPHVLLLVSNTGIVAKKKMLMNIYFFPFKSFSPNFSQGFGTWYLL